MVPFSLTVGIAIAVLDSVVELELEHGPRQLNAVSILMNRRVKALLSLDFIHEAGGGGQG